MSNSNIQITIWRSEIAQCIAQNQIINALKVCSNIELVINDDGTVTSQENSKFFFIFLIINIIDYQYLEARQLWYRIPDIFKNDIIFQLAWSILKYLWNFEIRLALQLTASTQWPAEYVTVMESLQKSIRHKQLELISKAYRNMLLQEFCSTLNLTFDEAEQICHQHRWTIAASNGNNDSSSMDLDINDNPKKVITFTSFENFINSNPPRVTDIRNTVTSYQELTKVIAFIDTKTLKVNLHPKKDTNASGSSNFVTNEGVKSQT